MLDASRGVLTREVQELAREWLPQWKTAVIEALRAWDADFSKTGPCLFSLESDVPYNFWTDLGPRLADKVRLHVHCEHTLLPTSWLKHEVSPAPGVFAIENPKEWLLQAGPVMQGLARLLGAAALLTAAADPSAASCFKDLADISQAIFGTIGSRHTLPTAPEPGATCSWDLRRPDEATGEALKRLHQVLRDKLGERTELSRAPSLGLVRVWNRPHNRYAWVHPLYASHYGGAA